MSCFPLSKEKIRFANANGTCLKVKYLMFILQVQHSHSVHLFI